MSEVKGYVSRSDELGSINISEDVVAVIAAAAALEVEGVSSLAANLGSDIAELLGKKNLARGVDVQIGQDSVIINISIMVKYGATIQTVAKAVQEAVYGSVESMSSLAVESVNINIGGITFEKVHKTP